MPPTLTACIGTIYPSTRGRKPGSCAGQEITILVWRKPGSSGKRHAAIRGSPRQRYGGHPPSANTGLGGRILCAGRDCVRRQGLTPQNAALHFGPKLGTGPSAPNHCRTASERWWSRVGRTSPPALTYALPPAITRMRNSAGRSGGRRGGMSANCIPHPLPRGSSRHAQSAEVRTRRSSRRISEPYLAATRASR